MAKWTVLNGSVPSWPSHPMWIEQPNPETPWNRTTALLQVLERLSDEFMVETASAKFEPSPPNGGFPARAGVERVDALVLSYDGTRVLLRINKELCANSLGGSKVSVKLKMPSQKSLPADKQARYDILASQKHPGNLAMWPRPDAVEWCDLLDLQKILAAEEFVNKLVEVLTGDRKSVLNKMSKSDLVDLILKLESR